MKNNTILNILFEFTIKYPKEFLLLFILLFTEGIASISSMIAIVPLADFFIDQTLLHPSAITKQVIVYFQYFNIEISFWTLGLLFVLTYFFKGILEVFVKYSILKIKYTILKDLFTNVLTTFFNSKWTFFSVAENGVILNTLNKELNNIGDTLGQIATLFAQFVHLFIFLLLPFVLNFKLSLIILSLSIFFSIPFLFLNKISYELGKENTETANEALGYLSELILSAKLILGYGKQKRSTNKFLIIFNKHINTTLKSQILSTAIPRFFQPLVMLSLITAIGFSLNSNTSISELAAILWSFVSALPILSSLVQGGITINNFLPSYEQLIRLRNIAEIHKEINGNLIFAKLKNGIEFKQVSFAYDNNNLALNNINININKGKMIALIGESGSGKSTITDLLLGIITPFSGEILIDNIPFNDFDKNIFRQKIGYVPQEPLLFHDSIRNNLLWSNEKASENEIWQALKLANADNFVKDLPMQLDTLVGDRGTRLSGGQRQRIALARALVKNPFFLILDEATSALDNESEILIQNSIEKISNFTTILVIAHRLTTISKADYVYILKNGKVVEEGEYILLENDKNSLLSKKLKLENQN
jgi:ABC-type multidrug transport system fused ATPase/permease subunit